MGQPLFKRKVRPVPFRRDGLQGGQVLVVDRGAGDENVIAPPADQGVRPSTPDEHAPAGPARQDVGVAIAERRQTVTGVVWADAPSVFVPTSPRTEPVTAAPSAKRNVSSPSPPLRVAGTVPVTVNRSLPPRPFTVRERNVAERTVLPL